MVCFITAKQVVDYKSHFPDFPSLNFDSDLTLCAVMKVTLRKVRFVPILACP